MTVNKIWSTSAMAADLTDKDKELYDRQIRVWGVEAQQRMQSCTVLVSGLNGVNCEVVKNLVLAGVNVTVHDDGEVSAGDCGANYFVTLNDVGKNIAVSSHAKIQSLNLYAKVDCETRCLSTLGEEYMSNFNVIILSSKISDGEAMRINEICRSHQISFFWSGTFGLDGWFICDLGETFEFTKDPPHNKEIQRIHFPSLHSILNTPWHLLQSRHSALPKTFMKSRLLAEFRILKSRGPIPGEEDLEEMRRLGHQKLQENGLDEGFLDDQLEGLCQS